MLALMLPRIALCSVCLLAGMAPALAQAPPGGSFRPMAPDGAVVPAPGEIREGPSPPGSRGLYIVEQPGNTLLATAYLGRSVHGPGGQRVGTVSNLLVDTTGRITGIVIDVGGILGFGAKEIAIAFEALFPVLEDGKEMFIVEMTSDQLTAAPAFKRSH
jgi:hypothetical protein